MTEAQRLWHIKNRPRKLAYMRKYRAKNKARCDKAAKEWIAANPERAAECRRKWAAKNKDKVAASKRKFKERNADHMRAYAREYQRQRMESDANFKLRSTLRCRLYASLKKAGAKRAGRTAELVGCDIQFLRGYLEARFQPGMTWENHGKWHVDHHAPLAEFDLRDPAQQKMAFHYSNLRPLWGAENQSKGAKPPAPHQAELI